VRRRKPTGGVDQVRRCAQDDIAKRSHDMSQITTHVLDTALGRPAKGVGIELHHQHNDHWRELGRGTTNEDGRLRDLMPDRHVLQPGIYRLTFHTAAYLEATSQAPGFYPVVTIVFEVHDVDAHYHVPLLLSPFGYSTYRGS
jgi:5-hydroxyisourate hydrolase